MTSRSEKPAARPAPGEAVPDARPADADDWKRGASEDDITIGEEAQAHREKMQRQEKAEGDRR